MAAQMDLLLQHPEKENQYSQLVGRPFVPGAHDSLCSSLLTSLQQFPESRNFCDDENGQDLTMSNWSIEDFPNASYEKSEQHGRIDQDSFDCPVKQTSVMQLMPMAPIQKELVDKDTERGKSTSAFKPYTQTNSCDHLFGSMNPATSKKHFPCATEDLWSGCLEMSGCRKRSRLMDSFGEDEQVSKELWCSNRRKAINEQEKEDFSTLLSSYRTSSCPGSTSCLTQNPRSASRLSWLSSDEEVDRQLDECLHSSCSGSSEEKPPVVVNLQVSMYDSGSQQESCTSRERVDSQQLEGEGTLSQSSFNLTSEDSSPELHDVAQSFNTVTNERCKLLDALCSIQNVMADADPVRHERWGKCWREYCQRIEWQRRQQGQRGGLGKVFYGSRAFF